MQIHSLDPYRPAKSLLHTADARVKFLLAIAFILTASLTPFGAWPVYILLFALIEEVPKLLPGGSHHFLRLRARPFVRMDIRHFRRVKPDDRSRQDHKQGYDSDRN